MFNRGTPSQLSIDERIAGPDRILSLRGFADIRCISILQQYLTKYRNEHVRLLVIDLAATEFINSPVWAAITLYARQNPMSPKVAIVGMSERIRGSFEMMGLHQDLPTFTTAEAARQHLNLCGR